MSYCWGPSSKAFNYVARLLDHVTKKQIGNMLISGQCPCILQKQQYQFDHWNQQLYLEHILDIQNWPNSKTALHIATFVH